MEISFSFFIFTSLKSVIYFGLNDFFVTKMHVQSHSRALTFLVPEVLLVTTRQPGHASGA